MLSIFILWVVICTYLIVAKVKYTLRSDLSIFEIMQILGFFVFDKAQIRELLTEYQIKQDVIEQLIYLVKNFNAPATIGKYFLNSFIYWHGIEIAKILEEKNPEIQKLILSANINTVNIAHAIEYGVLGILPKNTGRGEFISAIKKVAEGEQFCSDIITDLIIKTYIDSNNLPEKYQKKSDHQLSDREIEVIRCFAEGMIYKEIGDTLNISPRTVESHKVNILKKLNLNNIIDSVKFAIKNNIVSL